ncbi:MAG: helix-turn-helix domain-containing protein [Chloroflexota bacterium]
MKTSRQQLLDYVRQHRAVTAAELSRALHMTEANARHHLQVLHSQGLVQVTGTRPRAGKGRPAQLYGSADWLAGENLGGLASALLDELLTQTDPASQDNLLEKLAGRLAGDPATPGRRNLTQRLYETVQRLNDWHYQARWEAHAQAPRLILGSCPYRQILPEHPELCRLDAHLLARLLGAPVEQVARLAQDTQGLPHCIFQLSK